MNRSIAAKITACILSLVLVVGLCPMAAFGGNTASSGLKVKQVSLGSGSSAVVLSDGTLWVWGAFAKAQ